MQIADFQQLFPDAKLQPSGKYKAKCPAHDDRHPSFAFWLDKEGKIAFNCITGCSHENILTALKLSERDLYSTPLPDKPAPKARTRTSKVIKATYFYTDEDGEELYQSVRYEPKSFAQRVKDNMAEGGYRWNLNGVRRVPYNLPNVLKAKEEGRLIFDVEGEKDCSALAQWGYTATTNSGGCGGISASASEYLKALTGGDVMTLPDNDDAGKNRTLSVIGLLEGKAKRHRILILPGLPEKGDFSDFLSSGWTREQFEEMVETHSISAAEYLQREGGSMEAQDLRPVIEINGTAPRDVTAAAIRHLAEHNRRDPRIFWRNRSLHRIDFDADGRPCIVPITEGNLSVALKEAVRFVSTSKDRGEVEVLPPKFVHTDILSQSEYSAFPPLDGTITAPTFAQDGTLCTQPGYHPATRKYFHSPTVLNIPAMELAEARSLLIDDLLGDFPFEDAASRAHAVALTLLPFVKNMVSGLCPLHLIDAPTAGSGKTLLAKACAFPFLGAGVVTMTAPSDEAEWRKEVFSMMAIAPSHVLIDNVRGVLQSPMLESVLTSEEHQQRQLGGNEIQTYKNVTIWSASSNNAEVGGDLLRRSVQIRLDPQTENPSEREGFKHSDLLAWGKQNRGRLVGACVAIIQAWLSCGKPKHTARRVGSFEAWGEVMGGILEVAGIPGFLENRTEMLNTIDTSREAWRLFTEAWEAEHGAALVSAKTLFELAKTHLEEEISAKDEDAMRKRFGRLLARKRDTVFGGRQIKSAGKDRTGAQLYRVLQIGTQARTQKPATLVEYDLDDEGG